MEPRAFNIEKPFCCMGTYGDEFLDANERVFFVTCTAFHVSEKGCFTSYLHLVPYWCHNGIYHGKSFSVGRCHSFDPWTDLVRLRNCPAWVFTLTIVFRCNPWPDMTRHLLMWSQRVNEKKSSCWKIWNQEPTQEPWWTHDIHNRWRSDTLPIFAVPLLVYDLP